VININNQLVKINNTDLQIKEFNGQRVVTLKDIDTLHERVEGTARRNFNENKKHFIADEDYFKISANEIRTNKMMDISNMVREDVTFLTESGYLMLVKSFTDDLAWEVQRQLINGYFRAKNNQPIGILESLQNEILNTKKELAELKQAVYSDKRMKLTKKEKQLGISAPMSEKLSLISDEEIFEIIKIAMTNGLLRELDNGIAIDRNAVLEEAEKRHIAKQALNKKLLLMSIVVPNCDNYAYRQVTKDGDKKWCYLVKYDVVNE
jgi:hypothetical protein